MLTINRFYLELADGGGMFIQKIRKWPEPEWSGLSVIGDESSGNETLCWKELRQVLTAPDS